MTSNPVKIHSMSKIAFLGVAHIHTPAFVDQVLERNLPIAGVWDPNHQRAEKVANKLGCGIFEVDTLLHDPEVKSVVICSETHLHDELVIKAAHAKKAMFVEKPLGFATADAKRMAKAISDSGCQFSTGYFNRGNEKYQTIRQWMNEGKFGTVTRMRFSVCHSGAVQGWFDNEWRWMADMSQAGVGAFGDLGTHGLDILMWLGGEVAQAAGFRSSGTKRYEGCDEYGEGLLRFENGIIATLAGSWDDVVNPVQFQISGTEGAAWIIEDKLFAKVGEFSGEVPAERLAKPVPAGFSAFLDWHEGKHAELVPVEDAVSRVEVMETIYRYSEMI